MTVILLLLLIVLNVLTATLSWGVVSGLRRAAAAREGGLERRARELDVSYIEISNAVVRQSGEWSQPIQARIGKTEHPLLVELVMRTIDASAS